MRMYLLQLKKKRVLERSETTEKAGENLDKKLVGEDRKGIWWMPRH